MWETRAKDDENKEHVVRNTTLQIELPALNICTYETLGLFRYVCEVQENLGELLKSKRMTLFSLLT